MHQGVPGRRAAVGAGVELAYDDLGDPAGVPLVLVMGIGAQSILWDDEMCALFVARGYRVVRFDHRDIGMSTHLNDLPVPKPGPLLARRIAGQPVQAPYTLSDMARDVVGLMDACGMERAHVIGTSMGGMIAQTLAIEHAARLRSLTSIMSTPGARRYLGAPSAMRALLRKPPRTAEEAGESLAWTFGVIGSPAYPSQAARMRALGVRSFERGNNPRGFARQFAAILASGDRSAALRDVRVPSLVMHGSRDPLIPIRAGRATAALIPGATWLPFQGMGHDMPPALWPVIVSAFDQHARRADGR